MVAIDDFAWSQRDLLAGREVFRADRWPVGSEAACIVKPVAQAFDVIQSACLPGAVDDLRVQQWIIRGRKHVQHLTRNEGDDILVMRSDAGDLVGDVMPPLLAKQKRLPKSV